MRRVLYVAHALAPTPEEVAQFSSVHGGDIADCADCARDALSPELREAGLRDDCAVVERCDGIVLCGSRISSGMRREREHGNARSHGDWSSWDLTVLGLREPPAVVAGVTLDEWLDLMTGHE